ncbi:MAG: hypothetical protein LKI58_06860 [Actinomyces sp.]|nr:hypothetical protein [Actinomyces sp.]MCI1641955.1 hypothetical protein [Actinomyces sp.]MCI1661968.1 hypothetical protein [Actinomyces sp.]MCI1787771.1 hypothetical protein [Actinomyces sp.]
MTSQDGLRSAIPGALARQRELVEKLGGAYHQIVGEPVPEALLGSARSHDATQLVLGASRRTWLGQVLGGAGVGAEVIRAAARSGSSWRSSSSRSSSAWSSTGRRGGDDPQILRVLEVLARPRFILTEHGMGYRFVPTGTA